MAKRSDFCDFVKAVRRHWQTELPDVRPVTQAVGPTLPKASTFYAGQAPSLGMHVWVNFQHSSKSWEVGQFTINLALTRRTAIPVAVDFRWAPDDGISFDDGLYRISDVLGRKRDKWWHVRKDDLQLHLGPWRASSYDDREVVIRQAVIDVTRDLKQALEKLEVR